MGDEKLYLTATNELDFDNRDEAVWAKSMALHKGDEHQARYKYISTRVEQLATENPSSESMPITQSIVYSPAPPLIEVAEFANSNGISIDEAIDMINDGILKGEKRGNIWFTEKNGVPHTKKHVPKVRQEQDIIDSKPSSSIVQSHNAYALPVKATTSAHRSTQATHKPSPYSSSERSVSSNKYPSLLVSFWFIYVLGTFLISLISGPLSSVFSNHHSDMLEMLTAKIQIMSVISFVYLLIAALIVHLSSSEYRVQMFQWHYLARGIVFLHVLFTGFYLIKAFQS
jgi:hypothetical protein